LNILLYATLLIGLINFAYFFIKEKGSSNREKFTCYECGFESKIRSRIPFSLRFFILTIVYLLFDIEVLVAFSFIYRNELPNEKTKKKKRKCHYLQEDAPLLFFVLLHGMNLSVA